MRVGILISKYNSGYYGPLLDSAIRELERRGDSVICQSTELSNLSEREAWRSLVNAGCEGLILKLKELSDEQIREMVKTHPQTVLINRCISDIPKQCVCADNIKGARLAVNHLLKMGHHEIAMITGPMEYKDVQERTIGAKSALQDSNIAISECLIENGGFTTEGGAWAFRQLLNSNQYFSAVFVQNDDMAAGVIEVCHSEQISVPEELSIVGFDDSPIASITNPKLTTVRHPIAEAGVKAASILHKMFTHTSSFDNDPTAENRLSLDLVVRDSVENLNAKGISRPNNSPLTNRERECLYWVASGKTSDEASVILGISKDTVNFHLANLLRKLNASNRANAVAIALTNGLISPGFKKSGGINWAPEI